MQLACIGISRSWSSQHTWPGWESPFFLLKPTCLDLASSCSTCSVSWWGEHKKAEIEVEGAQASYCWSLIWATRTAVKALCMKPACSLLPSYQWGSTAKTPKRQPWRHLKESHDQLACFFPQVAAVVVLSFSAASLPSQQLTMLGWKCRGCGGEWKIVGKMDPLLPFLAKRLHLSLTTLPVVAVSRWKLPLAYSPETWCHIWGWCAENPQLTCRRALCSSQATKYHCFRSSVSAKPRNFMIIFIWEATCDSKETLHPFADIFHPHLRQSHVSLSHTQNCQI